MLPRALTSHTDHTAQAIPKVLLDLADMDPDFNSSDVDLGPAPERPYQSAGKSSLERMLDNAFEDRIESKRVTKNLTFSRGAPGTQYAHSLWYNRFSTFYTGTLGLE